MDSPRPEIADIIARSCEQLGQMGIRVEGVILFGSHARGEAKEGSDIDLLIVSPDFEGLNTRERLERLGCSTALATDRGDRINPQGTYERRTRNLAG